MIIGPLTKILLSVCFFRAAEQREQQGVLQERIIFTNGNAFYNKSIELPEQQEQREQQGGVEIKPSFPLSRTAEQREQQGV